MRYGTGDITQWKQRDLDADSSALLHLELLQLPWVVPMRGHLLRLARKGPAHQFQEALRFEQVVFEDVVGWRRGGAEEFAESIIDEQAVPVRCIDLKRDRRVVEQAYQKGARVSDRVELELPVV